ncbi:hypothetical protein E2C01_078580 [Portunus trituberculatus]|uniref:Uncharacterized protein n=1 Tax=Portunus trituberculatus TaxID=210409 RepID=A0A5B7IEP5_PORTR|nr:hypothetical protein [Portunus trituberculatus]
MAKNEMGRGRRSCRCASPPALPRQIVKGKTTACLEPYLGFQDALHGDSHTRIKLQSNSRFEDEGSALLHHHILGHCVGRPCQVTLHSVDDAPSKTTCHNRPRCHNHQHPPQHHYTCRCHAVTTTTTTTTTTRSTPNVHEERPVSAPSHRRGSNSTTG